MPSSVLTASPVHAPALAASLERNALLVVGLCAAWCNTCTEFRGGFDDLAARSRDATFVWLDIEDDADLAGEIDVENFPTIAVYQGGRLVHFGVSEPQAPLVARLLASLNADSTTVAADDAVETLPRRLARLANRSLDPGLAA